MRIVFPTWHTTAKVIFLTSLFYLTSNSIAYSQEKNTDYKSTGLPVCYIDCEGTISKDEKLEATMRIESPDGDVKNYETEISGHGNSTWSKPKKPYNLKFEHNESVLGLSASKKYVLLANYYDPCLWRNGLGYGLGALLDYEYKFDGRYVELVLNGKHKGCYYLTERMTRDNVPYDKNTGCIVEYAYSSRLDNYDAYFTTTLKKWNFVFKEPSNPDTDGDAYKNAVDKMNEFESAVFEGGEDRVWADLINWDSFVKWYYWKNIMQMDECNRYYVFKDNRQSTSLRMGPQCDFDWTLGINSKGRYKSPSFKNKLYYSVIGKDSLFLHKVALYHFEHRNQLEKNMYLICDSLSTLLASSKKLDEVLWNNSSSGWKSEMEKDRAMIRKTFGFLDDKLAGYVTYTAIEDVREQSEKSAVRKLLKGNQVLIIRNGKHYTLTGSLYQEE